MAPRSTEQFQAIREESSRRIVEGALALFARHGYAGTTIRMIAKEAGVSLGLLYNYFAGKEELLREIFRQGMADIGASFAAAEAGGDPAARIERLLAASLEIALRNRHFWLLFHALRMQPAVIEGLAPELATWNGQVHAFLAGLLRDAGADDPEIGARILFATVDGLVQHALLDPEHYPAPAVAARAAALFRASLLPTHSHDQTPKGAS